MSLYISTNPCTRIYCIYIVTDILHIHCYGYIAYTYMRFNKVDKLTKYKPLFGR